jgi:hypothetical protein
MHILHSLFYLTTALHVSGITITHLQEHKTTVTTASGNRYTVIELKPLISAGHRHHAYVSNHMKTKTDQLATHNTLKSVPTLPR